MSEKLWKTKNKIDYYKENNNAMKKYKKTTNLINYKDVVK